jgi:hypothetical protein
MGVIGFEVSKQHKQYLKDKVHEMCVTKFAHPQDPNQFLTFLPPGSGLGTLVKVATEQYLEYFEKVKADRIAKAQAAQQTQTASNNPPPAIPLNPTEIAQAAIARSAALREASETEVTAVTTQGGG